MHDPARLTFGDPEVAASFEDASVALLPAPYEGTVSWVPGTARAPEAILRATPYLEYYDEQLRVEPWRAGLWVSPPVETPSTQPAEAVARRVEARVGELMDQGKWVMLLGGEHSVTPGAVRAAAARHPDLAVVQLDAHADLRREYRGDPYNHACAMARCLESAPVRALGVRSYTAEEARWMAQGIPGYRLVHAWEMTRPGWEQVLLEGLEGRPVYLTFDVDYFDPSFMPATGTPEPGGPAWYPTLRFLELLCRRARVVGGDVVELSPIPGLHHAEFTTARLVYKIIGMVFRDVLRRRDGEAAPGSP